MLQWYKDVFTRLKAPCLSFPAQDSDFRGVGNGWPENHRSSV